MAQTNTPLEPKKDLCVAGMNQRRTCVWLERSSSPKKNSHHSAHLCSFLPPEKQPEPWIGGTLPLMEVHVEMPSRKKRHVPLRRYFTCTTFLKYVTTQNRHGLVVKGCGEPGQPLLHRWLPPGETKPQRALGKPLMCSFH